MKNHVRKALALLLAATMAVSMTACGGGKKDDGAAKPVMLFFWPADAGCR